MTDERDDRIEDLLPDWVAGRLDGAAARAVERAVAESPRFSKEVELLERLLAARPEPPRDLGGRIIRAVHRDARTTSPVPGGRTEVRTIGEALRTHHLPRWALAAAALAALTFGSLEVVERRGARGVETSLEEVALDDVPSPWASGDGYLAGAPVLDDLPDEALSTLLAELDG